MSEITISVGCQQDQADNNPITVSKFIINGTELNPSPFPEISGFHIMVLPPDNVDGSSAQFRTIAHSPTSMDEFADYIEQLPREFRVAISVLLLHRDLNLRLDGWAKPNKRALLALQTLGADYPGRILEGSVLTLVGWKGATLGMGAIHVPPAFKDAFVMKTLDILPSAQRTRRIKVHSASKDHGNTVSFEYDGVVVKDLPQQNGINVIAYEAETGVEIAGSHQCFHGELAADRFSACIAGLPLATYVAVAMCNVDVTELNDLSYEALEQLGSQYVTTAKHLAPGCSYALFGRKGSREAAIDYCSNTSDVWLESWVVPFDDTQPPLDEFGDVDDEGIAICVLSETTTANNNVMNILINAVPLFDNAVTISNNARALVAVIDESTGIKIKTAALFHKTKTTLVEVQLESIIRSVSPGRLVAVVLAPGVISNATDLLFGSLRTIGCCATVARSSRDVSWACVGAKGAAPGMAVETKHDSMTSSAIQYVCPHPIPRPTISVDVFAYSSSTKHNQSVILIDDRDRLGVCRDGLAAIAVEAITGETLSWRNPAIVSGQADSLSLAAAASLKEWIESLPSDTCVVVTSVGYFGAGWMSSVMDAIYMIGGSDIIKSSTNSESSANHPAGSVMPAAGWCLIGFKGANKGTALEAVSDVTSDSCARLSYQLGHQRLSRIIPRSATGTINPILGVRVDVTQNGLNSKFYLMGPTSSSVSISSDVYAQHINLSTKNDTLDSSTSIFVSSRENLLSWVESKSSGALIVVVVTGTANKAMSSSFKRALSLVGGSKFGDRERFVLVGMKGSSPGTAYEVGSVTGSLSAQYWLPTHDEAGEASVSLRKRWGIFVWAAAALAASVTVVLIGIAYHMMLPPTRPDQFEPEPAPAPSQPVSPVTKPAPRPHAKRCLLVCLSYVGTPVELPAPSTPSLLKQALSNNSLFPPDQIKMLLDIPPRKLNKKRNEPLDEDETIQWEVSRDACRKTNILKAIRNWLMYDPQDKDVRCLIFSGHGVEGNPYVALAVYPDDSDNQLAGISPMELSEAIGPELSYNVNVTLIINACYSEGMVTEDEAPIRAVSLVAAQKHLSGNNSIFAKAILNRINFIPQPDIALRMPTYPELMRTVEAKMRREMQYYNERVLKYNNTNPPPEKPRQLATWRYPQLIAHPETEKRWDRFLMPFVLPPSEQPRYFDNPEDDDLFLFPAWRGDWN